MAISLGVYPIFRHTQLRKYSALSVATLEAETASTALSAESSAEGPSETLCWFNADGELSIDQLKLCLTKGQEGQGKKVGKHWGVSYDHTSYTTVYLISLHVLPACHKPTTTSSDCNRKFYWFRIHISTGKGNKWDLESLKKFNHFSVDFVYVSLALIGKKHFIPWLKTSFSQFGRYFVAYNILHFQTNTSIWVSAISVKMEDLAKPRISRIFSLSLVLIVSTMQFLKYPIFTPIECH